MVQTNHNDSSYFKTNLIGTQMHTINTPFFPSAAIPDLIANTLEVNALRVGLWSAWGSMNHTPQTTTPSRGQPPVQYSSPQQYHLLHILRPFSRCMNCNFNCTSIDMNTCKIILLDSKTLQCNICNSFINNLIFFILPILLLLLFLFFFLLLYATLLTLLVLVVITIIITQRW